MSPSMKLIVLACLVPHTAGILQAAGHSDAIQRHRIAAPEGVHYGDSRCPCIGFDNIEGETMLELEVDGKKTEVAYPADMGARCEAWDSNRHIQCKSSPASWCAQEWCYVDPCNCAIDVLPKVATLYNTEATYRGKPLFWSYATCGGKDMFTKKVPELGSPKCRCIGFAGVSGTTAISLDESTEVEFPADLGTSCQAWDLKVRPECKGDKPPAWCPSNWCYVDPCDCDLGGDIVPKISAYLPTATFTGKNIYFSYDTCGNADAYTEDNHPLACVNQATKDECALQPRCDWTGSRCLGRELVNHPLCKDARKNVFKASGRASCKLSLMGSSALLIVAVAAAGRA